MPRKRGNTEGTIRERPDGRWEARLSVGWDNGKRIRKSFFGRTRGEVADKLREAIGKLKKGLPITPEKQTVAAYLRSWLDCVAKPNTRPKTYRTYSDIVNQHLIPALGRLPLGKLAPQQVRNFMQAKLAEGYSARSVKHYRDTLRAALNVAVRDGLLLRNPAALVTPPRQPKRTIVAFGPEQARRFLAVLQGHRLEALFSVALALGLRQGEILGLQWSNIDMDNASLMIRGQLQRDGGTLRLVELKTDASRRTLRLPQMAVSAFRAHRERQEQEKMLAGSRWLETEYVFTTSIGTPIEARNLLRDFYAILLHRLDSKGRCTCRNEHCEQPGRHPRYADLPRIRFHDLRHSAATLLLVQGVHPRMVQEVLGHTRIETTLGVYSHVLESMQQEAADKMDAVLNPVGVNVGVKQESTAIQ